MRVYLYFRKALVTALLPLLVISCKKGDTGSAGATGPAGPAGPTGQQGPAGSANVIYSDWFTPDVYKKDTVFGSWGFNYDKADATITQKIIDSGTVITFGKLTGYISSVWSAAQISALPIIITYKSGADANIDTWSAILTPGNLRIRLVSSLNLYLSVNPLHKFRYVIIPGGSKIVSVSAKPGIVSSNGRQLDGGNVSDVAKNYQQMSYSELCQRLNIEP